LVWFVDVFVQPAQASKIIEAIGVRLGFGSLLGGHVLYLNSPLARGFETTEGNHSSVVGEIRIHVVMQFSQISIESVLGFTEQR
jgi:hypothetical protein